MPDYQYGALRLVARAALVGGSVERTRAVRQVLIAKERPEDPDEFETVRDDVILAGAGERRPTIIIAAGVQEFERAGRRFLVVPASGAEIMGPGGHIDLAPGVYEVS